MTRKRQQQSGDSDYTLGGGGGGSCLRFDFATSDVMSQTTRPMGAMMTKQISHSNPQGMPKVSMRSPLRDVIRAYH